MFQGISNTLKSLFRSSKLPLLEFVGDKKSNVRRWKTDYPYSYITSGVRFIHVGKCGGTSIIKHFLSAEINLLEYHLQKPKGDPNHVFFLWIRNPLKRFVSAFNHSKSILTFDINSVPKDELTIHNCPAPAKIVNRIEKGIAFDEEYDVLIASFDTANELAEALTSSDDKIRERAHKLMSHPQEHIFKGIGWYLNDGQFVEKYAGQLAYVGRLEYMEADFQKFVDQMEWSKFFEGKGLSNERSGSAELSKELSPLAIDNLRKFYADSDYKALEVLKTKGFIDQQTIDEYKEYKS